MATCKACGLEMLEHGSCTVQLVELHDGTYQRIRYGQEQRYGDIERELRLEQPEHCHDCSVALGGIHHQNCDWEECPKCGRQLLSCDC